MDESESLPDSTYRYNYILQAVVESEHYGNDSLLILCK